MKMKRHIMLLLAASCLAVASAAQDLESIRKQVTLDPDVYAGMLQRFQNDVEPLSNDDCQFVYYGYAFTPQYRGNCDLFSEMYAAIKAGDREKALEEALKCKSQNPVCLELLYQLATLNDDPKERESYVKQFSLMLGTVMSSGDGLTPETAFKVIRIGDEYKVLQTMFKMGELRMQSRLVGDIDEMTLYFDTAIPSARDSEILGF